ncbi:NAD(P)-dependent oxidoreductase [Lacipirellula parvula]|uniref:D-lactate dehydrogenase n=1 Tax=Lacipirellula parvula TaxID=2650471 RepID=A0A5K7XMD0_9BACT|nr:NAD(P)-dependent oxidoreductase [Lacipirellula parvula]BBO35946.1 D-lactate dehydrogenase [Lacipirellula parvula]
MLDVYFYEAFEEEAEALRRLLPASFTAGYTDLTIQETSHAAPPARVISVRTQSILPLAWAPELQAIISRSTGYDHLTAYAAATKAPVALGYLPLYCHRAVAEQAMLLWMALLRRLPVQMRQFHDFHRDGITGFECEGRTLAVVGVGHIGREVCRIGAALGMRVVAVDRAPTHADVNYVSIDEALPQADVLVCAMDLNASNHGYFGADQWKQVKRGAVFVNVSRGELSPSAELVAALNAGQLSAVGMDVYNHEPKLAVALRTKQPSDDAEVQATLELARRDDVICTPHNAFNSFEAVERKSDHSVQQIVALRNTGKFLWNAPVG